MKLKQMLYEKREKLGIIIINNADRMNCLSEDVLWSFGVVLEEIERDSDVLCVILTGAGNKAFCCGADITTFQQLSRKQMKTSISLFQGIEQLSKPVIAAVNGYAYGAGFEITLASDIVVASREAKFRFPEANLGVAPFFGIIRLHQEVGRHRAKEIMMSGDSLTADEAFRVGLANRVVDASEVMEVALEIGKNIVAKAPLSVQLIKSGINRETGGADFVYAVEAASYLVLTEDVKEGMRSFFEKRSPVFRGR